MGSDFNEVQTIAVMVPIVAIVIGGLIWIVSLITCAARKSIEAKEREQSRRELAAYVAEGSITPDDAAKLLNAGKGVKDQVKI